MSRNGSLVGYAVSVSRRNAGLNKTAKNLPSSDQPSFELIDGLDHELHPSFSRRQVELSFDHEILHERSCGLRLGTKFRLWFRTEEARLWFRTEEARLWFETEEAPALVLALVLALALALALISKGQGPALN